jgi:membrane-bound metal-dependent hydrolase YbcI (DUF457 family)
MGLRAKDVNTSISRKFLHPLWFARILLLIWCGVVVYTLFMQNWPALIIALAGLVASLMVLSAIQMRRRKNFYPDNRRPVSR